MRAPEFRADQHARLHEPHISPITRLVDSLRTPERWLPYVAPIHGGVRARIVTVLRDPGRGTADSGGSGMLCVENDDQTAATMSGLMESAGLSPNDFMPWNAYPWFIDRAPTDAEIRSATPALMSLLALLPDLEVVLLHGAEARSAWRAATDLHPAIYRRRLVVMEAYHPSVRALQSPLEEERTRRIRHREQVWREAGMILAR